MTVEACRSASCVGVRYEIASRSLTGAAKNLSQAQLQVLERVVARWVNNRCSCTTDDDLSESESGEKSCVSFVGVNAAYVGRGTVPPLPPLLRSQSPRKPCRPWLLGEPCGQKAGNSLRGAQKSRLWEGRG